MATETLHEKSVADAYDDTDLLSKLMVSVPTNHRVILWLFVVEQYSHEEIALLVSKSPSYSKSIVSRCLQKLKDNVKENESAYM